MGDMVLWSGVALLVVLAALGGFALGRSGWPARRTPAAPAASSAALRAGLAAGLAADLIRRATPLDLLPGNSGEPLARCLPRSAGPEGLVCELLDSAAALGLRPGRAVTCFFAPVRQGGLKVNSFETEVVALHSALEPPQVVLRAPMEFKDVPRRRHARKRVSDPRFVHVRLWAADAETSRLFFPEATPDIWINAYDGQNGGENAVTDISPGGLAMEVRAALVPPGLEPGSPVVLKCSLFQFKEKQFKPYWYAGLVRGVSAPDDKLRRIAIGFTAVGVLDGSAPQGVRWTERIMNETQGDRA
ncbi:MAG: hypothetical protein A2051_01660 [Desulfovibrionales bacterium GWA2_65_9]|nr:MAG: hypothetical protein A2051_01660 [Desulfovibrionales bacterium GWA2_65_9]